MPGEILGGRHEVVAEAGTSPIRRHDDRAQEPGRTIALDAGRTDNSLAVAGDHAGLERQRRPRERETGRRQKCAKNIPPIQTITANR